MLSTLVVVAVAAMSAFAFNATDPVSLQLSVFKQSTTGPIGVLSLSSGCPVEHKYATCSINTNLLRNEYFIDSINHVLSEKIPERLVHPIGTGAFGYFEVTHDVTDICKAMFLSEVGKRTKVAARLSPAGGEKGGNDLAPGVRGIAIKFYTEDGNFDILSFSIDVFVARDPIKFVSFTHSSKNNPVTDMIDNNMGWDYITQNPESFFSRLMVFADAGIPASYRCMATNSVHTYQLSNSKNESYFSRFYLTPDLGVKNLLPEEAQKIMINDNKYLARDLYNAISKGDSASWTLYMQPLTLEDVIDARKEGFDVFDVTKRLSQKKYPLRQVGKLVLNENPKNFFADVEQMAFCPGNIVPGILGAPDKMFEARAMAYRTAHAYRLGINFNKLPVNRPHGQYFTYNRDGAPTIDENEGGVPNYYPNFFHGPETIPDNEPCLLQVTEFISLNIDQATEFYNELSTAEKDRTANSIAVSMQGLIDPIERRALKLLTSVDPDLTQRVKLAIQRLSSSDSD